MDSESSGAFWSEEARQVCWTLVSFSRRGLGLAISPTIANSFVFMHHYFGDPSHERADLYLLLIAALFLACKIEDAYRPLTFIFREFSRCALELQKRIGARHLAELIGARDFARVTVTDAEAALVTHYEIAFLNLVGWEFDIDTPFRHADALLSGAHDSALCGVVLRNLCLLQRSELYLRIPPPVAAAAAVSHALCAASGAGAAAAAVGELRLAHAAEFALATDVLEREFGRCAPCSAPH